jgi:hypothetical protein
MARRSLLAGSGLLLLSGCKTTELASALELMSSLGASASGSGGLTSAEIAQGLKQALSVGTARTVQRVGRQDGYFRDAAIHIFLPDELRDVQETLRFFGLSALADDVELKLNRAAEQAAEKTKPIFLNAIARMTLQDVIGIWKGPEDAATRYFQRTTTPALRREIAPVVDRSLNAVGALKAYETMMGEYRRLPLVPDVRADLRAHALDRSVAGLFHYVAREEAEIRRNPAARSTELLRRVFA